ERAITGAFDKVEERRIRGEGAEAQAALHSAQVLLNGDEIGDGPLAAKVRQWQADLYVVGQLEDLHLRQAVGTDPLHADQHFRETFKAYGLDVEAAPEEAVQRIQASAGKAPLVALPPPLG